mgnify:FL=1
MASSLKNLSEYNEDNIPSGKDKTVGIVVSEWNRHITHALYEGCVKALKKHEVAEDNIHVVQVPGTFELPTGAKMLAGYHKLDAVICLGCVIKGETKHDEYINQAVANGLTTLGLASGIPCIFGVLTPNTEEQAKERAGGKHGNKGVEAAVTALRMADLRSSLKSTKSSIGFGK